MCIILTNVECGVDFAVCALKDYSENGEKLHQLNIYLSVPFLYFTLTLSLSLSLPPAEVKVNILWIQTIHLCVSARKTKRNLYSISEMYKIRFSLTDIIICHFLNFRWAVIYLLRCFTSICTK